MGGDLKHGRTARSLSQVLAKYDNNHITYVSMPELQIGDDIKIALDDHGTSFEETSDMYEPLHDADVVYWTRLQKERLENPDSIPQGGFVIDRTALESMSENAIIMHPLPRIDEITTEVDGDPRAKYFEQAENGLYVRMALLDRAASSA
jgi:aspartate carbamoyltransferase catalytic subunit